MTASQKPFGAVAQLGERMTGSHEVRGSIPLGSIDIRKRLGAAIWLPLTVLCAYRVPSSIFRGFQHTLN